MGSCRQQSLSWIRGIRRNQTPSDLSLAGSVLMMILRGKRFSRSVYDLSPTALATVYARISARGSGIVDRVEIVDMAYTQEL